MISSTLKVAIVRAGATGTELAAQLHHVANLARSYGIPKISSKRLVISIIEAGEPILPALPERVANFARSALTKLGIKVLEGTRIIKAQKEGFVTSEKVLIEAY
jgi:NADH dehydrogenase